MHGHYEMVPSVARIGSPEVHSGIITLKNIIDPQLEHAIILPRVVQFQPEFDFIPLPWHQADG